LVHFDPELLLCLHSCRGCVFFIYEVLQRAAGTILATALFFLNGGFTFAYYLDRLKENPGHFSWIIHGGATPETLANPNITLWNVVTCIIIPQRSTMAGWAILFFALWLLYRGITQRQAQNFWISGILGGLLCLVHVPSCLVFLVIAVTWALVYIFLPRKSRVPGVYFLIPISLTLLGLVPQGLFLAHSLGERVSYSRFVLNGINDKDIWIWYW